MPTANLPHSYSGSLKQVGLIILLLLAVGCRPPENKATFVELPRHREAPDFELTDSTGESFVFQDHPDKVRIVSFFFSSCPSICPKINDRLADLIRPYKKSSDLLLVSISVDPERDTPEVLQKYGADYWEKAGIGENPSLWRFVTASDPGANSHNLGTQKVNHLLNSGFKLASGMSPDDHNTRVVLVDKEGIIRGFYQGRDSEQMHQLANDLSTLLTGHSLQ